MKYRKLTVAIDAVQFSGSMSVPIWLKREIQCGNVRRDKIEGITVLVIHTLGGNMIAHPGDYIIKGVDGEVYPCKASIFHKTYEPVLEDGELNA